jgi:hypothetical protein
MPGPFSDDDFSSEPESSSEPGVSARK